MLRDFDLEKAYQHRVHELVVIRDVQANDSLIGKARLELGREFVAVSPLHDEDQVSPNEELRRNGILSIVVKTSRGRLDPRPIGKHVLGRWATEPVLTANEKNVARHVG